MAYCVVMIDTVLSRALQVDGERRGKDLVFFSLSTCVMCKKAQRYLEEKGYAYKIIYVDELGLQEKEQLKEELSIKYGMRVVFPALSIDNNKIVLGSIRHAWDKVLGEN